MSIWEGKCLERGGPLKKNTLMVIGLSVIFKTSYQMSSLPVEPLDKGTHTTEWVESRKKPYALFFALLQTVGFFLEWSWFTSLQPLPV